MDRPVVAAMGNKVLQFFELAVDPPVPIAEYLGILVFASEILTSRMRSCSGPKSEPESVDIFRSEILLQ